MKRKPENRFFITKYREINQPKIFVITALLLLVQQNTETRKPSKQTKTVSSSFIKGDTGTERNSIETKTEN
jgi:hypothetical protein